MFCVIEHGNIIAIHRKKEVIKEYCDHLQENYPNKELYIVKLRKNAKFIDKNRFDDLYLCGYMNTYIQSGYVKYLDIVKSPHNNKFEIAYELLMDISQNLDISKKEKRSITNVLRILERIKKKERNFTPSLEELEMLKEQYLPYENGYYE